MAPIYFQSLTLDGSVTPDLSIAYREARLACREGPEYQLLIGLYFNSEKF